MPITNVGLILLPSHTLSNMWFKVLPYRCLLLGQDLRVLSAVYRTLAIPLQDGLESRYEPTVNRLIVRHLNLGCILLRYGHLLATVLLIASSFHVIVVLDRLLSKKSLISLLLLIRQLLFCWGQELLPLGQCESIRLLKSTSCGWLLSRIHIHWNRLCGDQARRFQTSNLVYCLSFLHYRPVGHRPPSLSLHVAWEAAHSGAIFSWIRGQWQLILTWKPLLILLLLL